MSNQPPKEVTQAPIGYEWTGEWRVPRQHEPFIGTWRWDSNGWDSGDVEMWGDETPDRAYPILRKIKPPTLMVEVPREAAEWVAQVDMAITPQAIPLQEACRKALEAEGCGKRPAAPATP